MARYIEEELLLAELDPLYIEKEGSVPDNLAEGFAQVEKLIKKQPTADVVEVVHGEWERIPYSFAGGYRCSCCGCKSLERHWKHCPNCGAKMDEKKVE